MRQYQSVQYATENKENYFEIYTNIKNHVI